MLPVSVAKSFTQFVASKTWPGSKRNDITEKGFGKTLVVKNPGAKQSCGCGTSFSYDDAFLG